MSRFFSRIRILLGILVYLHVAQVVESQTITHEYNKEDYELKVRIIKKKIDRFLLPAMRESRIDMWIVMSRENNLDPILSDIGGGIGGHRNAYIFMDDGTDRVKRVAIGTHLGDVAETRIYDEIISYHSPGVEGLNPHLRKIVEDFDPQRIGINTSRTIPMCDGLTVEMKKYLEDSIREKYTPRLTSAEKLIVQFRAHRVEEEIDLMRKSFELAKKIHHEVLSERYVQPGETTLADIYWSYRAKMKEYGIEPGWPGGCPGISIAGKRDESLSQTLVEPGDFMDVNFGVDYLDYCSDVNRQAYILKPGEKQAPKGLREFFDFSLKYAKKLKDNMRAGETGLDIHLKTTQWLKDLGYESHVCAHTIGNTVHGIGPLVDPDYPDRYGDRVHLRLEPIMFFAVEIIVPKYIEELDKTIRINRQDDAVLTETRMEYLSAPQTRLILIKSSTGR